LSVLSRSAQQMKSSIK